MTETEIINVRIEEPGKIDGGSTLDGFRAAGGMLTRAIL